MDRALYGTEEVVVQNGETIIKRRRYNERLVMFMLRNRAPERFSEGGARGLSAVDRMQMKRLKQEWRREWEAERDAEEAEEGGPEALTEMLETMHRNWFAGLSPATRAAYAEFRRLARADKENWLAWADEPGLDQDAEQQVIDAQYEEHFGPGKDNRAGIWKVSDVEGVGEADVEEELRQQGPQVRSIRDERWD